MDALARVPALALVASLLPGCSPEPEEVRELSLLEFRQAGRDDVALNEPLVFHFSAELDSASITRESVRVLDPEGRPVRGTFSIRRSSLELFPALPLEPDLEDGGLRPGTAYAVVLVGFPRPDGVRARGGEPLDRTYRASFRTARPGADTGLFLDLTPGKDPPTLTLVERELSPLDPILLACGEPLDPTSVDASAFLLLEGSADSAVGTDRIPLRASLVENRPDGSLLALRPLGGNLALETLRALEPGRPYFLLVDPGKLTLRTLRRRGLLPFWSGVGPVPLRVVSSTEGVVEDFEDTARRSPEAYPGADGTATWAEPEGSVRVRYPLAAGRGSDGRVVLGERETRADLHAVRIDLPAERICELETGSGLTVLRSQGRIEIQGVLRRRAEPGELGWRADETHAEWRGRVADRRDWSVPSLDEALRLLPSGKNPPKEEWPELSSFLAQQQAADPGWTVIVAGGDLVVTGRIETDSPVLLVAGGWVRVPGRVDARRVFQLGNGGGRLHPPRSDPTPLRIDEPRGENPLVEPLHLACISNPIRPAVGLVQWRAGSAEIVAPTGFARVSFLGVREREGLETDVYGPVEDLRLLEGCQFLRFVVELRADPGEEWAPPEVRSVEITWAEPGSS